MSVVHNQLKDFVFTELNAMWVKKIVLEDGTEMSTEQLAETLATRMLVSSAESVSPEDLPHA